LASLDKLTSVSGKDKELKPTCQLSPIKRKGSGKRTLNELA